MLGEEVCTHVVMVHRRSDYFLCVYVGVGRLGCSLQNSCARSLRTKNPFETKQPLAYLTLGLLLTLQAGARKRRVSRSQKGQELMWCDLRSFSSGVQTWKRESTKGTKVSFSGALERSSICVFSGMGFYHQASDAPAEKAILMPPTKKHKTNKKSVCCLRCGVSHDHNIGNTKKKKQDGDGGSPGTAYILLGIRHSTL